MSDSQTSSSPDSQLVNAAQPVFRRSTKTTGAKFDEKQATLEDLVKGKKLGLLCKDCHKRIPWSKLTAKYYQCGVGTPMVRMWFCECGLMVKEEVL